MSDEKNKPQRGTTTTTTDEATESEETSEGLSPTEEKAVRMLHGLDEEDDHELQFGLGADEKTLARLANLEKFLVEKFEETRQLEEGVFEIDPDDNDTKRHIIDTLRDQDD